MKLCSIKIIQRKGEQMPFGWVFIGQNSEKSLQNFIDFYKSTVTSGKLPHPTSGNSTGTRQNWSATGLGFPNRIFSAIWNRRNSRFPD
jgi:hypothetical protein